jgi:hypothetical protein
MKKSSLVKAEKKHLNRSEILSRLVFRNFYSIEGMSLEAALTILAPYRGEIEATLRFMLLYAIKRGWRVYDGSRNSDYGGNTEESILNTLQYISDRFGAEIRLWWVLDLIDGKIEIRG